MILQRCLTATILGHSRAINKHWSPSFQLFGRVPTLCDKRRAGHLGSPLHKAVRMASSTAESGDTGAVTVFVTVPSEEFGEEIAGLLVNPEARLAACVNIIPGLKSIYWWDGKVQKDEELLLVMKTQTVLLQQLVEAVKKHHPYDEPEVISLPITGGSSTYIKWIHDSTGGS
ncbi:g978 [Coccomyxa viridis]|uniref:G978 protein n=1 Tax=Coccomyxa viridis TaxID=1274662 RepID=A0ABP1FNT6_9CHLO